MFKTLCILMVIDMAVGILSSLFIGEGAKKGSFSSTAMVNGFIKKFIILLVILAYKQIGDYDWICLFFISGEIASITEHAKNIGVYIKKDGDNKDDTVP